MTTTTNSTPEKTSGWEEWATRTTAILAVLAALSSGRWGASNLQAILEQGKVNDTWSYYQAKSMKQHEAEQARDMARALLPGQPPERAATLADLQKHMEEMAQREEREKNDQEKHAEYLQQRRDRLVESSFWYEVSFAGLQLGVILCTIAAGAKRKVPWAIGIIAGVLGLVLLINGVHRFWSAPPSWYQGAKDQRANPTT